MRRALLTGCAALAASADMARANPPPLSFMPLVSESWGKITRWNGAGHAPAGLSDELSRLADLAHAQGPAHL